MLIALRRSWLYNHILPSLSGRPRAIWIVSAGDGTRRHQRGRVLDAACLHSAGHYLVRLQGLIDYYSLRRDVVIFGPLTAPTRSLKRPCFSGPGSAIFAASTSGIILFQLLNIASALPRYSDFG
jgi:hypothetical protein